MSSGSKVDWIGLARHVDAGWFGMSAWVEMARSGLSAWDRLGLVCRHGKDRIGMSHRLAIPHLLILSAARQFPHVASTRHRPRRSTPATLTSVEPHRGQRQRFLPVRFMAEARLGSVILCAAAPAKPRSRRLLRRLAPAGYAGNLAHRDSCWDPVHKMPVA
jgi:hypothetical protein